MVLCWMWDAGLPRPLCNVPVFDLSGRLVAIVDLLDPVAGCVGEYQGENHKSGARHRADVARHESLRAVGLETFEVVGGDLTDEDLVVRAVGDVARLAVTRSWAVVPINRVGGAASEQPV